MDNKVHIVHVADVTLLVGAVFSLQKGTLSTTNLMLRSVRVRFGVVLPWVRNFFLITKTVCYWPHNSKQMSPRMKSPHVSMAFHPTCFGHMLRNSLAYSSERFAGLSQPSNTSFTG